MNNLMKIIIVFMLGLQNRIVYVHRLVLCVFGRDETETLPESHGFCPQIR